jgi:hypothetical protein
VEDRRGIGRFQRGRRDRLGNDAVPFREETCKLLGTFAVHRRIVIRPQDSATLHWSWKSRRFEAHRGLKDLHTRADDEDVQALEPAFFIGLGLVAVWLYLRYPRLRPSGMTGAIAHVGVSFLLFNLAPSGLHLCVRMFPAPLSLAVFTGGVLIPTLGYVLVSWVWLMARIHDLGTPTPRGGHPVRGTAA